MVGGVGWGRADEGKRLMWEKHGKSCCELNTEEGIQTNVRRGADLGKSYCGGKASVGGKS